MSFIYNVAVIILFSLIFNAIDLNYNSGECILKLKNPEKTRAFFLIFAHHILAVLSNFGWLSNNRAILLLFVIINAIIIIHWLTNKNKCMVTTRLNKICGKSPNHLFPDFFYIIGLKNFDFWNNWASYIYYVGLTLFAVFKLVTLSPNLLY